MLALERRVQHTAFLSRDGLVSTVSSLISALSLVQDLQALPWCFQCIVKDEAYIW